MVVPTLAFASRTCLRTLSVIAFLGHFFTHSPQPVQASLTSCTCFNSPEIASNLHVRLQIVHPIQRSRSIAAIFQIVKVAPDGSVGQVSAHIMQLVHFSRSMTGKWF